MRKRPLGRTGLDVSVLCLGTMTFGWSAEEDASFAIMSESLERGINFFDTADIYSRWSPKSYGGKTEEIMGRWFAQDRSRRDKVILATKVRGPMSDKPEDQGLSRRHIVASIENSLKRLQTDHVELYQSHWIDNDTPHEETLRAYEELIKSGKVRAIGCSNFSTPQLDDAQSTALRLGLPRYETLQPEYSLVVRSSFERELQARCIRESIGVIPYSPLAGGFLTGKYRRGQSAPAGTRGESSGKIAGYIAAERNFDLLDKLEAIARERATTIAAIALSWVIDAPSITSAIVGANTVGQLTESLAAESIQLTAAERNSLNDASSWQS
jgi:1-deoxyxylulose-5-phosphate synthase